MGQNYDYGPDNTLGTAMTLTIANDAMLEGRGPEIDGDQLSTRSTLYAAWSSG